MHVHVSMSTCMCLYMLTYIHEYIYVYVTRTLYSNMVYVPSHEKLRNTVTAHKSRHIIRDVEYVKQYVTSHSITLILSSKYGMRSVTQSRHTSHVTS